MTDNGGFTLNGVAINTYSIELRYGSGQPMLPASVDRAVAIPGRDGQLWQDSSEGSRVFQLPCQFTTTQADAAALDVLIRAFARVLVDVDGKPRTLSLVFDDAPTLTYTVRYHGEIPFDRLWAGSTSFILPLIADDPYGYESEEVTTGTVQSATGGQIAVTSTGTVSTPAVVTIYNYSGAAITSISVVISGWRATP